ncbi:MAG: TMEM165/GDT1 family protein [Verrucomicrobia bacterium]|jgi:Ca2+/H+ antiporter, TMEM165/GDT1 family|nr:TMEM165/GDT1 family protein [Verrucomicrobiota bacterium]
MSWKLFLSTFVLIFLAELGDKTQLAAMARTASSGGAKWVVFWAASSALILSTLVAVLFGHVLTKFIPEHVLKLTAGGLFILFGILILYQALSTPRAAAAKHPSGLMVGVVLKWAGEFEQAAAEDYETLASQATDPELRALLQKLSAEERDHIEHIKRASAEHETLQLAPEAREAELPERDTLSHDVAHADRPLLEHAIEHEEATAQFYRELARLTPLRSLKRTFTTLAEAELDHARRLKNLG